MSEDSIDLNSLILPIPKYVGFAGEEEPEVHMCSTDLANQSSIDYLERLLSSKSNWIFNNDTGELEPTAQHVCRYNHKHKKYEPVQESERGVGFLKSQIYHKPGGNVTINTSGMGSSSATIQDILKTHAFPNINLKFSFVTSGNADVNVVPIGGNTSWTGPVGGANVKMQLARPSQSIVLHEFGHALGMMYELQNPNNNLQYNKAQLYSDYQSQYGWSQQYVDQYILQKFPASGVYATAFDPHSVMVYNIPGNAVVGGVGTTMGTVYSNGDLQWLASVYGAPSGVNIGTAGKVVNSPPAKKATPAKVPVKGVVAATKGAKQIVGTTFGTTLANLTTSSTTGTSGIIDTSGDSSTLLYIGIAIAIIIALLIIVLVASK